MRLCRFNEDRLGIVEGTVVRDVTPALDVLPRYRYPLPAYDVLIANLDDVLRRARATAAEAPSLPLAGVKLLSPVANPGKIVAAPLNYKKHLAEVLKDPELHHHRQVNEIQKAGMFLKANSSLVGPGEGIALRKPDRRNDHEVELVFVIGKTASNVAANNGLEYVAGYCIGLDITIRGPEERSMRKSPDSYTVLGPWLVTADEIENPRDLRLSISVNGEVRQSSSTDELILGVGELVEFASSFFTLHPGDIIFTGTPEGVGPLKSGDVISASIDKIGAMELKVR